MQSNNNIHKYFRDESTIRRAIFSATEKFLSLENRYRALIIFEKKHISRVPFDAQDYMTDLCQSPALKEKRSEMLQLLAKFLNTHIDQLPADPELELARYKTKNPELMTTSNADHSTRACVLVIQNIFSSLNADEQFKAKGKVLNSVNKSDMASMAKSSIQSWLTGGNKLKMDHTELNDRQLLINLLYTAVCEFRGPVLADQMLNKVVTHSIRANPNLDLSIRELL